MIVSGNDMIFYFEDQVSEVTLYSNFQFATNFTSVSAAAVPPITRHAIGLF